MMHGYKWKLVIVAIGDFHANRLMVKFGGEKVKLSTNPNTAVCKVIGAENIERLMDIYQSNEISIPMGVMSADEKIRMHYISLRLDHGKTIAEARRICGRSEPWAYRMEKKLKNGTVLSPKPAHNQLDLMDWING